MVRLSRGSNVPFASNAEASERLPNLRIDLYRSLVHAVPCGAGQLRRRRTGAASGPVNPCRLGPSRGRAYSAAGLTLSDRCNPAGLGISRNNAQTTAEMTQRKASP